MGEVCGCISSKFLLEISTTEIAHINSTLFFQHESRSRSDPAMIIASLGR
jgi:hypothetical protein